MPEPSNSIATVSLARPLAEVADELGESFRDWGFAVVCDHGIPADLVAEAWEETREFFALPDAVKREYFIQGLKGQRGYTPFGTERAKDAAVQDLKEFWHVGRSLPPGDPLEAIMPPNIWPGEVPEFRPVMEQLYTAFEAAGGRILQAIALHLGLSQHWFDPAIEKGNSVMRLLHYPPLPEGAPEGAIRAAAHGDINTITLLLGAEEAGLQLLTAQGDWLAITPPEGALVVNIGDMLERLTNDRLVSTTHRVVNPVGPAARRARYSMPFFLHFRPDFTIETLPQCIDAAHPDHYPQPLSSHDFLLQRLREINLA
jgi:isopenicillin N synthase-like dioxygenase